MKKSLFIIAGLTLMLQAETIAEMNKASAMETKKIQKANAKRKAIEDASKKWIAEHPEPKKEKVVLSKEEQEKLDKARAENKRLDDIRKAKEAEKAKKEAQKQKEAMKRMEAYKPEKIVPTSVEEMNKMGELENAKIKRDNAKRALIELKDKQAYK